MRVSFCALAFLTLLVFALFNTKRYLYGQGKWRVFSLSMFYILSIISLTIRIITNIFSIWAAQYMFVSFSVIPAVIKVDIGLIQVAIIVEIAMRVRENMKTFSVLTLRQRQRSRNLISDIIASRKKNDIMVRILQVFTAVTIVAVIVWTVVICLMFDLNAYSGMDTL